MRDFFYNKSDVLIAILIILIAALVIYTRVGIIMDYPSKMAGGEGNAYLPPIQEVLTDVMDGDGIGIPAKTDADVTQDVTAEITTGTQTEQPPADVAPAETADPPAATEPPPAEVVPAETAPPPTAEVTITVAAGDVGSKIADKLLTAGAITDKAAFLAEVTAQGADTKLKQGTFTIPAGATLSEIVKILVG
jgi:hypothetical protein